VGTAAAWCPKPDRHTPCSRPLAIRRAHPLDQHAHAHISVRSAPSQSLTGQEMAERFVRHRHRMNQRSRRPGPFIYFVHRDSLELVLSADDAD
jgi:hypothetical protein